MCQRGNPYQLVGPVGVPVSFGAPPAWGAPGHLGTAAAGGLRRVPGSPVIQGCSRYYGPAWPYGCAGRRARATASAVCSFHLGCRLPYAASVSVRMAVCSCLPSASARIWWIAKTGHRLGFVGVSAFGSGMVSICCRPSM